MALYATLCPISGPRLVVRKPAACPKDWLIWPHGCFSQHTQLYLHMLWYTVQACSTTNSFDENALDRRESCVSNHYLATESWVAILEVLIVRDKHQPHCCKESTGAAQMLISPHDRSGPLIPFITSCFPYLDIYESSPPVAKLSHLETTLQLF